MYDEELKDERGKGIVVRAEGSRNRRGIAGEPIWGERKKARERKREILELANWITKKEGRGKWEEKKKRLGSRLFSSLCKEKDF